MFFRRKITIFVTSSFLLVSLPLISSCNISQAFKSFKINYNLAFVNEADSSLENIQISIDYDDDINGINLPKTLDYTDSQNIVTSFKVDSWYYDKNFTQMVLPGDDFVDATNLYSFTGVEGGGSLESPLLINSEKDFQKYNIFCNNGVSLNAKLMSDIELSQDYLINNLKASFDGNNHSISIKKTYFSSTAAIFNTIDSTGAIKNLNYKITNSTYVTLFNNKIFSFIANNNNGSISNSKVLFESNPTIFISGSASNMTSSLSLFVGNNGDKGKIDNLIVSGSYNINCDNQENIYNVSLISGNNYGDIANCTINSDLVLKNLSSYSSIVYNNSGKIDDCNNNGTISMVSTLVSLTPILLNGIANINNGEISNTNNKGNLVSTNYSGIYANGICYKNNGTIFSSCNLGNLYASDEGKKVDGSSISSMVCGICTYNEGTISYAYNMGELTIVTPNNSLCYGITSNNSGTIEKTINSGNLLAKTSDGGLCIVNGLTGFSSGNISYSKNSGNITCDNLNGFSFVSCLTGSLSNSSLTNSYNTGNVSFNGSSNQNNKFCGISDVCFGDFRIKDCYSVSVFDNKGFKGKTVSIAIFDKSINFYNCSSCINDVNGEVCNQNGEYLDLDSCKTFSSTKSMTVDSLGLDSSYWIDTETTPKLIYE